MSTPLTDADLDELRARLTERLEALRDGIANERGVARSERIGQYSGEVHDRGEESSVDAAAEVNDAIIDQHEAEVRAIRLALTRIDEGGYGDCGDCGQRIGRERLEAWPMAARCVACQEQAES